MEGPEARLSREAKPVKVPFRYDADQGLLRKGIVNLYIKVVGSLRNMLTDAKDMLMDVRDHTLNRLNCLMRSGDLVSDGESEEIIGKNDQIELFNG